MSCIDKFAKALVEHVKSADTDEQAIAVAKRMLLIQQQCVLEDTVDKIVDTLETNQHKEAASLISSEFTPV